MLIKFGSLLLFFFLLHSDFYAQKIIILKENPEAPGEELIIYRYNQPFFDFKIPVAKVTTGDKNGVETNLKETCCLYIDYGPFQTYFFAEPERSYLINLPETDGFSDDWKKTPYFKPSKHHLTSFEIGEQNLPSELNDNIREFDTQFEPFVDKQLLRYYDPKFAREKLDSFLQKQVIPDKIISDDYYNSYIYYKKGILEYILKTHNLDKLTEEYFTNKEIHFSNPAYRELFSMVFQSYFSHLEDKENYRDVYYQLATKQYPEIESYLSDIELFKQSCIFLNILMNELYQAYYSINFEKKRLLEILRTIIQITTDPDILNTAKELERSFISLGTSYHVPDFQLTNIKGERINLTDFKGKYIYLGFCNLENLSCLRELEYLKLLYARQSQNIVILHCLIGEENTEIESFIDWHGIQWEIIPVNQNDKILIDYKVFAFPVFYLIDKDGTLLRNPAPNPSENFEYIFTEILRSRRIL